MTLFDAAVRDLRQDYAGRSIEMIEVFTRAKKKVKEVPKKKHRSVFFLPIYCPRSFFIAPSSSRNLNSGSHTYMAGFCLSSPLMEPASRLIARRVHSSPFFLSSSPRVEKMNFYAHFFGTSEGGETSRNSDDVSIGHTKERQEGCRGRG